MRPTQPESPISVIVTATPIPEPKAIENAENAENLVSTNAKHATQLLQKMRSSSQMASEQAIIATKEHDKAQQLLLQIIDPIQSNQDRVENLKKLEEASEHKGKMSTAVALAKDSLRTFKELHASLMNTYERVITAHEAIEDPTLTTTIDDQIKEKLDPLMEMALRLKQGAENVTKTLPDPDTLQLAIDAIKKKQITIRVTATTPTTSPTEVTASPPILTSSRATTEPTSISADRLATLHNARMRAATRTCKTKTRKAEKNEPNSFQMNRKAYDNFVKQHYGELEFYKNGLHQPKQEKRELGSRKQKVDVLVLSFHSQDAAHHFLDTYVKDHPQLKDKVYELNPNYAAIKNVTPSTQPRNQPLVTPQERNARHSEVISDRSQSHARPSK